MIHCDIHVTIPVRFRIPQGVVCAGERFSNSVIKLEPINYFHNTLNLKKSFESYEQILDFKKEVEDTLQFPIIRFKVEVPPDIVLTYIPSAVSLLYIEHHLKFPKDYSIIKYPFLKSYAISYDLDKDFIYYTSRYEDIIQGRLTLEDDFKKLEHWDTYQNKLKLECCIIDTNPKLDKGWL